MLNVIYAQCHKKPFKLCVVILIVIMLSVIMLNVVAPYKRIVCGVRKVTFKPSDYLARLTFSKLLKIILTKTVLYWLCYYRKAIPDFGQKHLSSQSPIKPIQGQNYQNILRKT